MRSVLLGSIITVFLTMMSPFAHALELEVAPGLTVGSKAPDFTATIHEGKNVTLSELTKEGRVVLVFYRGAWCPYCNIHLRQFQQKLDQFAALGASVLGVSIDLQEYANQTVRENELGFDVISDSDASVLSDYNLLFSVPDDVEKLYREKYNIDLEKHSGRKDHVIAIPATYVIDEEGTIVFAYASKDYKARTSPDEVLQVLKMNNKK